MAGQYGGSWWNPIDNIAAIPSKIMDPNYDLIPKVSIGGGNANSRDTSSEKGATDPYSMSPSDTAKFYDKVTPGGSGKLLGANTTYDPYSAGSGGTPQDAQERAETLAYLADQEGLLRQMLGQTGIRRDQGLTQIGDEFNREQSSANQQRGRFVEDLNVKREDTTRDKMGAIGRVDNNARTLADSVRRQIGMASGSGSSAYKFAAPGAVAKVASEERSGVQDTYGKNFRDLATTEKRGNEDFESLLADLQAQRQQKERGLREGIGEQEIGITGQLADLARQRASAQGGDYNAIRAASSGLQADRQARQQQLNELFDKFRTPYAIKPVNVQTPELSAYNTDRAAIGQNQQTGANDPTAPYGRFLRPEDEEERRLV